MDHAPPPAIVNGSPLDLADVPAHTTALDFLRSAGLTGAKEGCAEGECGACAVMIARPGTRAATEWTALNACLVPAAALAGAEVVTSEGLGDSDRLHPVQYEMAVRGGSQCGYCTPGFICSMAAEYYRPERGDHFDDHALSGNLCRCTGYRPIRDAAEALGAPEPADPLLVRTTQAPPPTAAVELGPYRRPASLADALAVLRDEPDAAVVAGSTDVGVEVNLRGFRPAVVVAIGHLPELREFTVTPTEIRLGAALTLSEIEQRVGDTVPLLAQTLPQFASRLIRNGATIGGNLGTGSPIGDLAPALLALDAAVVLVSARGERTVQLAEYFTGYRRSVRDRDELIAAVRIPLPLASASSFLKIAKRRFDDISSAAVACAFDVDDDGVVRRARIGLGGVAATPVRAYRTEDVLTGRPLDATTIAEAAAVLATEGTPLSDHRASAEFRAAMLGQALPKFLVELQEAGR